MSHTTPARAARLRRMWRFTLPVLLLLAGLVTPRASACNVPVFRYALERWTPSPFDLVVFHRGPLTEAQLQQLAPLTPLSQNEGGQGNFYLTLADLAATEAPLSDTFRQWGAALDASTLPRLVLAYPDSLPEHPAAWSGPLDAASVLVAVDSPARREIAARLLRGQSAVWLLIAGRDRGIADAAEAMLVAELAGLEKSLELPELDEDDPKLHAELPLKIAFSVLRIAGDDPVEQGLVSQVRQTDPALGEEPTLVVPIFGRGRALGVLKASELNAAVIADAASFMCGPCSCEVKDLNPGFDLMIAADWDAVVEGREITALPLPSLAGIPSLAASIPPSPPGANVTPQAIVRSISMVWVVFLSLGVAVGLVALLSLIVYARTGGKRAR